MSELSETDKEEFERLKREHALLIESIEVTPVAVAVYDDQDRLIVWNKTYEKVHAQAFKKLREKVDRHQIYYADLVQVMAESTMSADKVEAYVRQRVTDQREADGVGVDRHYPDVGWLRISKFKTKSGATAGFAVDINENKRYEARLQEEISRGKTLEDQLRFQANTDAMTQIPNRGAFLERAEMEFRRGTRYGDYLSVIMMDADFFKQVNDTHGHAMGDKVLVGLARTLNDSVRDLDMVGRMGGEEFATILVHATLVDATACAERIRHSIASLVFESAIGLFRVTASFGVTQATSDDLSFSEVMSRADLAMYSAKRTGRNKVCSL